MEYTHRAIDIMLYTSLKKLERGQIDFRRAFVGLKTVMQTIIQHVFNNVKILTIIIEYHSVYYLNHCITAVFDR